MKRIQIQLRYLAFFLISLTVFLPTCGGSGDNGGGEALSNADLASLTVSNGVMNPSFDPSTTAYTCMFIVHSSITIMPTAADTGAKITVNGTAVISGQASQVISLNPGQNAVTVVVTAQDGVTTKTYAVTANLLSQQVYIKASNTGHYIGYGDSFGSSVSLSGDTLAVGARGEDSNATGINGNEDDNSADNSGAVYVFTRAGMTWTQQAYIKASNTNGSDAFGSSVSLSGDTLAVGAVGEASNATGINGNEADNNARYSGAVYVFTRAGTTWTQQAYIKASNTNVEDYFGSSVSLSGDTLAVAAPFEASNATGINGNEADNNAPYAGAVYVWR